MSPTHAKPEGRNLSAPDRGMYARVLGVNEPEVMHGEALVTWRDMVCAGTGALGVTMVGFVAQGAIALRHPPSAPAVAQDAPVLAQPAQIESCAREMDANRNLVEQVREYKGRLERMADDKATFEPALDVNEPPEAVDEPAPARSEWDIDAEERTNLAKRGVVKERGPCSDPGEWRPSPEALQRLGLAPQDARVLASAAENAYRQSWNEIKSICEQLPETQDTENLQLDACVNAIYESFTQSDPEGTAEALRRASGVRAGMGSMPRVGDSRVHPVEKVVLALAEGQKSYEEELARSLGPEDAHRVAFADELCATSVLWGDTEGDE